MDSFIRNLLKEDIQTSGLHFKDSDMEIYILHGKTRIESFYEESIKQFAKIHFASLTQDMFDPSILEFEEVFSARSSQRSAINNSAKKSKASKSRQNLAKKAQVRK